MATISDLFWRRVAPIMDDRGCWEWFGFRHPNGYGIVGADRKYAHRVSWELHFGAIPDGLRILHKCDNPSCVNPAHLSVGTAADNSRDMVRKRRQSYGERNGHSKLSTHDVEIIRRLIEQGVPQKQIGARFGVTQSAISLISRGINWSAGGSNHL